MGDRAITFESQQFFPIFQAASLNANVETFHPRANTSH